jgi:acyl-CoA thioester hydrolase
MVDNEAACGVWDKEGTCLVPMASIEELPVYHRETISDEYLDLMGHMNVRWYMALFGKAAWNYYPILGLSQHYFRKTRTGTFALKQFIQYYAEVRVDQTVSVRIRFLNRSERRFHLMHFMINETTAKLAATLEILSTFADLKKRRSVPIPPEIARRMDAQLESNRQLKWEAQVCGVIHV